MSQPSLPFALCREDSLAVLIDEPASRKFADFESRVHAPRCHVGDGQFDRRRSLAALGLAVDPLDLLNQDRLALDCRLDLRTVHSQNRLSY